MLGSSSPRRIATPYEISMNRIWRSQVRAIGRGAPARFRARCAGADGGEPDPLQRSVQRSRSGSPPASEPGREWPEHRCKRAGRPKSRSPSGTGQRRRPAVAGFAGTARPGNPRGLCRPAVTVCSSQTFTSVPSCARSRSLVFGTIRSTVRSSLRIWECSMLTKPHIRASRLSASCVPSTVPDAARTLLDKALREVRRREVFVPPPRPARRRAELLGSRWSSDPTAPWEPRRSPGQAGLNIKWRPVAAVTA